MKKLFLIIFLAVIGFSCFAQARAGAFQSGNSASAFMYSGTMSDNEQLKIYVYIWGQVKNAGLYVVPDDTDLLAIISLAGGPTENAKLSKIKVIRTEVVEGKDTPEEKVMIIDVKKFTQTGDLNIIPVLKPGDTIIIPGTSFYAFSKVTEFLSKVAIALGVYNTVKSISK